jgi:hypothetical protein
VLRYCRQRLPDIPVSLADLVQVYIHTAIYVCCDAAANACPTSLSPLPIWCTRYIAVCMYKCTYILLYMGAHITAYWYMCPHTSAPSPLLTSTPAQHPCICCRPLSGPDVCVLLLLCVSSYYYICVLILLCVLILCVFIQRLPNISLCCRSLTRPHTAISVSSHYSISSGLALPAPASSL